MSRTYNPTTLLIAFLLALAVAAGASEHPVPLEKGADTNCLECHEAKSKGKFVHAAVQSGCTTCHEVKNEGETTTVSLNQPKAELCFACHERSEDKFAHGPYASGRCELCHDPHSSDYPHQLRATGNDLCLGCHGPKSASDGQVFGSQQLTAEELKSLPKIKLDSRGKGHPFPNHPVAGRGKKKAVAHELSCFSCHQAHASAVPNLAQLGTVQQEDVLNRRSEPLSPCIECHRTFDWRSYQPSGPSIFWQTGN